MIKTAASVLLVLHSSQAFSPQSNLLVHHLQQQQQQHGTFMKRYLLHSSSNSNSNSNSNSRIDVSNTPLDQTESSSYVYTNPIEADSTSASWPSTTAADAVVPSSQQDDSLMSLNGNTENESSSNLLQTNTSIDASLLPTNSSLENLAQEIIAKVNTSESAIASSPPLTFSKFLTMQEKRVHVTIKFSNIPGLRPYFLTIANKIKSLNPDVIVEKQVMPTAEDDVLEETVFEVLVDGKVVIGKSSSNFQPVRRSGKEEVNKNKVYGMSVYVSMGDVNAAIGKARKKRRPSTSYLPEDREKAIRLEMLRGNDDK